MQIPFRSLLPSPLVAFCLLPFASLAPAQKSNTRAQRQLNEPAQLCQHLSTLIDHMELE